MKVKFTDDDFIKTEEQVEKEKKQVEKKKEKNNKIKKEVFEWIFCFVIAYVIYLNINFFFGTISGVKQVSMYPTAKEGDRLLIQRPTIFKKDINFGDIITFEAPIDEEKSQIDLANPVATFNEPKGISSFMYHFLGVGKKTYIKRVIGVAGDHIMISEAGDVYRNNERIEESYLNDDNTIISGPYYDVVVPEGTIFVMGDNRKDSKDSRYFGCVPLSKVNGYIITRIWPLNRLGKV